MTLEHSLTTLESSGLIRLAQMEPELEYIFRHALVQDAAYESLLKADRRILHRTVGEGLELLYPDRLDELAPLLAEHFNRADEYALALKYFSLAGDVAFRQYANVEAVHHYTSALELAKQLNATGIWQHLYLRRGRALELSNRYDEALGHYAEMETFSLQAGDQALELAALMAQTTVHCVFTSVFNLAEGQRLAEQSLTLARTLGNRVAEAKIFWNLLLLNRSAGNHARCIEYGEQSIAIARELNLREQLAYTLNDIGISYVQLGQGARARTLLDEARPLWRELGNLPMLAENLARTAVHNLTIGDFAQTILFGQEAYHLGQTTANLWGQMFSLIWVGLAYSFMGNIQQGLTTLSQALRLGEELHLAIAALNICPELALLYSTLGATERGFEIARQFAAYADKFPAWQPYSLAVLATLQARHGQVVEAETTFTAIRPASGFSSLLSPVALARAEIELALARGHYAEALAAIDLVISKLRQTGMQGFLPEMLFHRGRALMTPSQGAEAQSALIEASRLAETMNARLWQWRIFAALSDLAMMQKDLVQAQQYHDRAQTVITYIADHCTSELCESFLNLSDVK